MCFAQRLTTTLSHEGNMAETVDIGIYLDQVREVEILYHLKADELDRFLAVSEAVLYSKGEKIVAQGDSGNFLYAIVTGKADVSFRDLNDDEMFVSSVDSGDMFGEAAFFTSETRTASVTCADDTVALRVHKGDLLQFIKDNPRSGNKVLMMIILSLLKKLKQTNQELAYEKQSEIDFNYADTLIQDFLNDI
jgi:CRP-like cAMP-binding protein